MPLVRPSLPCARSPSRLPPPPRGPENEAPGAPHPQLPSLRKGAGAPMRAQSPAVVRPQALTGAGPRPAGADARAVESPGPRATRQGIREPRDPFARAGAGGGRRAGPLAPVASALPALESVPGLPSPSRDRPATHASATRPAAYEARRAQAAQVRGRTPALCTAALVPHPSHSPATRRDPFAWLAGEGGCRGSRPDASASGLAQCAVARGGMARRHEWGHSLSWDLRTNKRAGWH